MDFVSVRGIVGSGAVGVHLWRLRVGRLALAACVLGAVRVPEQDMAAQRRAESRDEE